jgi:hypothetical protein
VGEEVGDAVGVDDDGTAVGCAVGEQVT